MPIDRNSPTPLKDQLVAEMHERLASGEFEIGQKFPSLRSLAREYGVAEMTIQPAVQELQREGLLAPSRSKGNYVQALPAAGALDPVPDRPDLRIEAEVASLRQELTELRRRLSAVEGLFLEEFQDVFRRLGNLDGGSDSGPTEQDLAQASAVLSQRVVRDPDEPLRTRAQHRKV